MIRRIILTSLAAVIAATIFCDCARADAVYTVNREGFIYQLGQNGTITGIARDSGVTYCLAADTNGNLYTGNFTTGMIDKYTPGVGFSTFANYANPNSAGIGGMVFDSLGNLYVSAGGNAIMKFTPGGAGSIFVNTGAWGLAFDSAGNLYATSYNSGTIEKYSSTGEDLGVFVSGRQSNFFSVNSFPGRLS